MGKRLIRRFIPPPEKLSGESWLRWLKPLLDRPYLYHLNRHTVSRGLAAGVFWAVIPLPIQSPFAVLCAIKWRGNILVAWASTWLSNPATLLPHWAAAYVIGKFITRSPGVHIEWTRQFLSEHATKFGWWLSNFWGFFLPLFVGSVVLGAILAPLAYWSARLLWSAHAARKWRASRARAARLVGSNA